MLISVHSGTSRQRAQHRVMVCTKDSTGCHRSSRSVETWPSVLLLYFIFGDSAWPLYLRVGRCSAVFFCSSFLYREVFVVAFFCNVQLCIAGALEICVHNIRHFLFPVSARWTSIFILCEIRHVTHYAGTSDITACRCTRALYVLCMYGVEPLFQKSKLRVWTVNQSQQLI